MKIPHFKILVSIFMTIILGSCSTDDDFLIDGDFTRSIDMEKVSPTDLYPQVKDIIADKTVKTAMDSAWIETLSLANKNGRQEIGFYIYYDFDTKEFSIGKKNTVLLSLMKKTLMAHLRWVQLLTMVMFVRYSIHILPLSIFHPTWLDQQVLLKQTYPYRNPMDCRE